MRIKYVPGPREGVRVREGCSARSIVAATAPPRPASSILPSGVSMIPGEVHWGATGDRAACGPRVLRQAPPPRRHQPPRRPDQQHRSGTCRPRQPRRGTNAALILSGAGRVGQIVAACMFPHADPSAPRRDMRWHDGVKSRRLRASRPARPLGSASGTSTARSSPWRPISGRRGARNGSWRSPASSVGSCPATSPRRRARAGSSRRSACFGRTWTPAPQAPPAARGDREGPR